MQSQTLRKFYNAKNLIFITNYLQLINALELYCKKKINQKILIVTNNAKIIRNKKILSIICKLYNIKKFSACFINHKLNTNLLFNIVSLIIFKKYLSIINGNYLVDKFSLFMFLRCKSKYFVDDGTSTLLLNEKKDIEGRLAKIIKSFLVIFNFKITFFSSYDKSNKIFKSKITNNYNYLKKKISKKAINSNQIYILGTNLVDNKQYFLEKKYIERIRSIKSKFFSKKISYFPHPREKISKNLKNFLIKKNIKIIISKLPIEIYLVHKPEIPKNFISFYSSAFIVLKIIFEDKLNLYFYNDNFITKNFKKYQYFSKYFLKNFKKIKI